MTAFYRGFEKCSKEDRSYAAVPVAATAAAYGSKFLGDYLRSKADSKKEQKR